MYSTFDVFFSLNLLSYPLMWLFPLVVCGQSDPESYIRFSRPLSTTVGALPSFQWRGGFSMFFPRRFEHSCVLLIVLLLRRSKIYQILLLTCNIHACSWKRRSRCAWWTEPHTSYEACMIYSEQGALRRTDRYVFSIRERCWKRLNPYHYRVAFSNTWNGSE